MHLTPIIYISYNHFIYNLVRYTNLLGWLGDRILDRMHFLLLSRARFESKYPGDTQIPQTSALIPTCNALPVNRYIIVLIITLNC